MDNCIQSSALPYHGLYIHWPWCKKKCPYCDFNSHVSQQAPTKAYVDALLLEMETASRTATPQPLVSIFFGGGTPSLMSPHDVELLVTKAESLFGFTPNIEITLEANPTSSEAQKFSGFVDTGVNRFSVGMQSPEKEDLSFLGREHSADEAILAVQAAQKACQNVSLDLIYGLPKQDTLTWEANLKKLCDLGTQHLSAYQLTIEKNTKFYADMRKGKLQPAPDTQQADFYHATNDVLTHAGFKQYEVSNYCKNEAQCQHNKHVWTYGSYIGIGAGAHGRTHQADGALLATRNHKMPEKYIGHVLEHGHGRYEIERVTPENQVTEALLLGLRLSEGLPLARLEALNQKPWQETLNQEGVTLMKTNGFLVDDADCLKPTPQGMAMLEGVLGYLLDAPR